MSVRSIFQHGDHVANVSSLGTDYLIHNFRPNGTLGMCFTSKDKLDISNWLNQNYPGWVKGPSVDSFHSTLEK